MIVAGRLSARRADDRAIAAAVAAVAATEALLVGPPDAVPALDALGVAALALPLAWRRRAPLAAAVAVFAIAVAVTATLTGPDELSAPFVVVLLTAYSLGSVAEGRPALAGLAICLVGVAAVATTFGDAVVGDYLFPMGFAAAAWTAGRTIAHRSRLAAELHEAAVRAREARDEQAARAVREERRRIAREMHDVVGHSVSVMVVQAGGARRILHSDPHRALEAASRIEDTGRGALSEMRSLLGVLGSVAQSAVREPQPSLSRLGGLLDRARAAGLQVALHTEARGRSLPEALDVAAYRIVQEALTNAVKHAPGARVRVTVRWSAERLELVVRDTGGGATRRHAAGGHGLVGMRERAALFGGQLDAAPVAGGGFEVRARLPLTSEQQPLDVLDSPAWA